MHGSLRLGLSVHDEILQSKSMGCPRHGTKDLPRGLTHFHGIASKKLETRRVATESPDGTQFLDRSETQGCNTVNRIHCSMLVLLSRLCTLHIKGVSLWFPLSQRCDFVTPAPFTTFTMTSSDTSEFSRVQPKSTQPAWHRLPAALLCGYRFQHAGKHTLFCGYTRLSARLS